MTRSCGYLTGDIEMSREDLITSIECCMDHIVDELGAVGREKIKWVLDRYGVADIEKTDTGTLSLVFSEFHEIEMDFF